VQAIGQYAARFGHIADDRTTDSRRFGATRDFDRDLLVKQVEDELVGGRKRDERRARVKNRKSRTRARGIFVGLDHVNLDSELIRFRDQRHLETFRSHARWCGQHKSSLERLKT